MAKKELLNLMKTLRVGLTCRFDLLEYIASRANKRSKNYEYLVTRESIKRIDKDGNIEVVLETPVHIFKANYFYELEAFENQGFDSLYKNLEEYYEQNGYEQVTPLTPRQLLRLQIQKMDDPVFLNWLKEQAK